MESKNFKEKNISMKLKNYEKELLIETIEYRLENDETLLYQTTLKDELEDLLCKLEDE